MKDNTYIKILKKAKRVITNEDHYFICWAIYDNSHWSNDPDVVSAGEEIVKYIDNALGDCSTLGQWLACVADIPYELRTDENLKAYRLRYIDHLMEVFK